MVENHLNSETSKIEKNQTPYSNSFGSNKGLSKKPLERILGNLSKEIKYFRNNSLIEGEICLYGDKKELIGRNLQSYLPDEVSLVYIDSPSQRNGCSYLIDCSKESLLKFYAGDNISVINNPYYNN